MGIDISSQGKVALRKDTSLYESGKASGDSHLDELLEDLQGQLDEGAKTSRSLWEHHLDLMAAARNADGTVLDATGAAGNFKITAGGWGTGTLILEGEDAQNNTKTDTLCAVFQLPVTYEDDEDLQVIVNGRYDDTGGGSVPTATVDVEVYKLDDEGAVGADLCATAAQNLANTFADKTFTVTDAGLAAGDRLMVLVRTAITEAGNTGTLTAEIGSIRAAADIKA